MAAHILVHELGARENCEAVRVGGALGDVNPRAVDGLKRKTRLAGRGVGRAAVLGGS